MEPQLSFKKCLLRQYPNGLVQVTTPGGTVVDPLPRHEANALAQRIDSFHGLAPDSELLQLRATNQTLQAELAELKAHKDQAYLERNHLVAVLARLYPSGIRPTTIPDWDDEWQGCVYIDLPDAEQISYHYHDSQADLFKDLPVYTKPYNGHTKAMVHASLKKLWTWNRLIPVQWLYDWIDAARLDAPSTASNILTNMTQAIIRYQVAKVRKCKPEDI